MGQQKVFLRPLKTNAMPAPGHPGALAGAQAPLASRAPPVVALQAAPGDGRGTPPGRQQDWRAFRARLVKQEQQKEPDGASDVAQEMVASEGETQSQGWAHATPLIEQGSVLLSAPGDNFALNQQYFHKAVILIVQHDANGDVGLILNRPTTFTTDDLHLPLKIVSPAAAENALGALTSGMPQRTWSVWCGGDCDGLNSPPENQIVFCLHTLDALAEFSQRVISGVFLIGLAQAEELVAAGRAEMQDFMVLVGYCGWGSGQMQNELDRGDTWTMAAADQQALLGELRDAQALLEEWRGSAAESGGTGAGQSRATVEDGTGAWRKLYTALGRDFHRRLAQARMTGDDAHTDGMLRLWIDRCLLPAPGRGPSASGPRAQAVLPLRAGSLLRGSATAWLLGKPAEDQDFSARRFRPAQYLHKSVLLLLNDLSEAEPSVLVLLNGPSIGEVSGTELVFGGASVFDSFADGVIEVTDEARPLRAQGSVVFRPGVLQRLVELGALEVVSGVALREVLAAPASERWQTAGGTVDSLGQAATAALGDSQRRKWYRRFLNLELEVGE